VLVSSDVHTIFSLVIRDVTNFKRRACPFMISCSLSSVFPVISTKPSDHVLRTGSIYSMTQICRTEWLIFSYSGRGERTISIASCGSRDFECRNNRRLASIPQPPSHATTLLELKNLQTRVSRATEHDTTRQYWCKYICDTVTDCLKFSCRHDGASNSS
jgi:hypothetical protein